MLEISTSGKYYFSDLSFVCFSFDCLLNIHVLSFIRHIRIASDINTL